MCCLFCDVADINRVAGFASTVCKLQSRFINTPCVRIRSTVLNVLKKINEYTVVLFMHTPVKNMLPLVIIISKMISDIKCRYSIIRVCIKFASSRQNMEELLLYIKNILVMYNYTLSSIFGQA